ncbi:MAG: ATP-grasp domain-containing protein, partial [Clostridia bacterium]|nr:ATP-grasp domain-containing protein [Clostridia bacterium]
MNILFTSVGRRSYLVNYFKEALGELGQIHVANSSAQSPAFQAADYCVVTPLIYDENYIPFLINYCRENHICAIISLFDIDLPILSRNKQLFQDVGVNVIVSDQNVIDICNDKWQTCQYLSENNFRIPQTYLSLEAAVDAINQGSLQFPVMVKPRWGMGSIAVYEAENMEELRVFYRKTVNTIQKTYLKYESAEDPEKSVLIQEKIQGQEYGLDIINDLNGNYQTTICKKKYAMRSGETDCAVTVNS